MDYQPLPREADGCTCGGIGWDESYHELHRPGCPATLAPEDRPTPPIEPEAEPLTEHPHPLADELIGVLAEHGYGILSRADLDALNESIDRLTRERDEQRARIATMDGAVTVQWADAALLDQMQDDYGVMRDRALAAERQVEQLSRVVEAARPFVMDDPTYMRPDSTDYEHLDAALSDYDKGREG